MNKQKISQYFIFLILQISLINAFDCAEMLYCLDCNTEQGCLECANDYVINEKGSCDACEQIIPGCSECKDGNSCLSCESRFILSTSTSKCISLDCVDDGEEESYCTECTPDLVSCISCKDGYFIDKHSPYDQFYCQSCDYDMEGCIKCSPDGELCYECDTENNYTLNSQQQCDICHHKCLECGSDGISCIKCDNNHYLDTRQRDCNPCSELHENCTDCTNQWTCTKCTGLSEYGASPQGFCENCFIPGCIQCSEDGKSCLECYNGFSLTPTNTCEKRDCPTLQYCLQCTADVKSCTQCNDESYFMIERFNEMQESVTECATCGQIISNCQQCNKNESNQILCSICTKGTILSLDLKQCQQQCDLNQTIVSENSNRICQCSELFFFNSKINQCSQQCPEGQLGDPTNNICIPSNTCEGFISSDNKQCLAQCPILEIINNSNKQYCQKQTSISSSILSSTLKIIISNTNSQKTIRPLSDFIDTILAQYWSQSVTNTKIYSLLLQSVLALQNEMSKKSQSLEKIEKQSEDYIITILSLNSLYHFNCITEIDGNDKIISQPFLHVKEHSKCNEIDSDTLSIIVSKLSKQFQSAQNITIPYISFGLSSSSQILLNQSNFFQVNIPVDATNKDINKFECITMSNDQPFRAVKSTPNPNNSTITCQFVNNTSLIYDEKCEYVNSSFCQKDSHSEGLSTLSIVFIVLGALLGIFIAIIAYICIKRRNSAKQLKKKHASTMESILYSNIDAIN